MFDPIFNSTDLFLRDFGPRRYRHAGSHPDGRRRHWLRDPETGERIRRW